MLKFKLIAMGNVAGGDDKVNDWLEKNQNIEVVSTNAAWDGDSVMYCILYIEKPASKPGTIKRIN